MGARFLNGCAIVGGIDIYGGTDRLVSRVVPRAGVAVRRVDTSDLEAVRAEVGEDTKLVVIESPTNPRMMISNIKTILQQTVATYTSPIVIATAADTNANQPPPPPSLSLPPDR
ncbi:unnamed protein product [Closterium sp. NIES-64]|nr:unnamed protein product [Closterium sp. NIES-64]